MDLLETPLEIFDEQQSVNQRSTFLLMREGVRLMRAAGNGGRIVNVTTMGTLHPVFHGNAAYSASRAGVVAMTRSIAFDYAKRSHSRQLLFTRVPCAARRDFTKRCRRDWQRAAR